MAKITHGDNFSLKLFGRHCHYAYICHIKLKFNDNFFTAMSKERKNQLSEIMMLAWSFVRKNGYTMSEAMKCAWANVKLRVQLSNRIVEFYFKKVDGTLRQAFGTLMSDRVPQTKGTGRKQSDSLQTYFDTEKEEWRCFKKCNLVKVN